MNNISRLMKELDTAVLCDNTDKADEISDELFRLQGGIEAETEMPDRFFEKIKDRNKQNSGGQKSMSIKKIISIAAVAAVIAALGITALATRWFGIKDLVINNNDNGIAVTKNISDSGSVGKTDTASDAATPIIDKEEKEPDLIALQGYPDSNEYKASAEWNLFCDGYDTDQSLLNAVGNSSNEITEKYPMYLVYTQEMADKLEEIVKKYKLTLHNSITIIENSEELVKQADTGDFIGNANKVLGGYVYNDGTFHYDGEAVFNNNRIDYQFGNYVKGTFSSTYLNIGDANAYKEWTYKTSSGVKVSLALSENKALVIADLKDSYVTINVLTGTGGNGSLVSESITAEVLQEFADSFDYSKIN